jgi:hypothetical protein
MQLKTILSVDWDYFFPDLSGFDWQMNEQNNFYYESIWPFRWGNVDLFNPKTKANRVVHPNFKLLKNFWGNVFDLSYLYNNSNFIAYINDSHSNIAELIEGKGTKFIIHNFDQHHDIFYDNQLKLDCSNWAYMLRNRIHQYHLYYPPWRKEKPESNLNDVKEYITSINYELPDQLIDVNYVFVCRSSCWTPPWSDKQWLNFIFPFERSYKSVITDYVSRKRTFDFKLAKEFEANIREQMKGLNNEVK